MLALPAIGLREADVEERARGRERLRDRSRRSRPAPRPPAPAARSDRRGSRSDPTANDRGGGYARSRKRAAAPRRSATRRPARAGRKGSRCVCRGRRDGACRSSLEDSVPERRSLAELDRARQAAEDLELRIALPAIEIAADDDAPRMAVDERDDLQQLCRPNGAVEGRILDAVAGVDVGIDEDEGAFGPLDLDGLETLAAEILALVEPFRIPAETEAIEAARRGSEAATASSVRRTRRFPLETSKPAWRAPWRRVRRTSRGPGLLDQQDVEIAGLEALRRARACARRRRPRRPPAGPTH